MLAPKTFRPLRVAILLPTLRPGGVERVMLNLADGLQTAGHMVEVIVVRADGSLAPPAGVALVELGARRLLAAVPGLARRLRRDPPGVLIAAKAYVNVAALWARRLAGGSVATIVSEHGVPSGELADAKLLGRLMPALVRSTYPTATAVVAVSRGCADDLARTCRLDRERIRVIYNPVIGDDLDARLAAPVDHPWLAPGQPPVLLAAGRLDAVKDYPLLVRAFARLRAARPARLVILGEGAERPRLAALVRELGLDDDVALPGHVPDALPWMARAAALVQASRHEALPSVLIEALACRCPVIATDCPGGTREILEDGRVGALVPVGDEAALAVAMAAVLERTGRGPVVALERFGAFAATAAWLELLAEVTETEAAAC